ncbi:MAG: GAF domain-containing protein [Acidobacteria bacterium]|nr:MAG: GAF domain-containing protein [Acidobacteriota bacterium]REK11777.1 MAG: GAF domain-containing protein [Acidobacteriota bacterium]
MSTVMNPLRSLSRATDRQFEDGSALQWALDLWRESAGARSVELFGPAQGEERAERAADGDQADSGSLRHIATSAGEGGGAEPAKIFSLPCGFELRYDGVDADAADDASRLESVALLIASMALLQGSRSQLREQAFQESYRALAMEALYDVGLAIASTLNLEELSQEILLRAVSLLDARRGALYLREADRFQLEGTIGGGAADSIPVDRAQEPDLEVLPGSRHRLASPIEVDGNVRGVIVVGDKESRTGVGPFAPGDERALSLFANQAAIALENARLHRQALEKERLEREMELAAEIQRGLLPSKMPAVGDLEVAGWNRPTRQVGGDYYGSLRLKDGRSVVVVADVTGKGMPAALLVSTLHSGLHLLLDSVEPGEALLGKLNQHIHESTGSNKFITLLMLLVDPTSPEIRFLNAGHNPGLAISPSGEVRRLEPSGLPLGLLPKSGYRLDSLELGSGDLLCIFSDGITECESPAGEEYGEQRLCEFLRQHRSEPLEQIIQALDREVTRFADGEPQYDDQTVVLLRKP